MLTKIKIRIFKLLGIKYGPFMFPVRDYWIFIDSYQQIWKLKYTGQHTIPFSVSLLER